MTATHDSETRLGGTGFASGFVGSPLASSWHSQCHPQGVPQDAFTRWDIWAWVSTRRGECGANGRRRRPGRPEIA